MDTLPVAVHRQIDQFCIAYEQKLNAGKRPDLAKAVYRQKRVVQGPLLYELLAVELEWRLAKGESPAASQYLAAFPEHGAVVNAVCTRYVEKPNGETISFVSPEVETHALLVRCPECHARISPGKGDLSEEITCSKCGFIFRLASAQTALSRVGSRLGPFELLKELGAGAFGTVWRALDTRLDRSVAIKIPRRAQLQGEEFDQFMREARAAAQLRHSHIVQVHEVGRLDDIVYIVSDFIDGWTLADWLEGQRLTIPEAIELAVPIAEALHHAHECGVIHRDLKPANILVDRSGKPYLTDFGLARREAGEVTITMEGQLLGTPAYMSPEQASGAGHRADRRTDVYSFGVLLFQLFTGELPFRGSMRVLLRQVMEDEPPSPRRFNSRLPRDVETIVLKCLEKDPARRYATALAVCEDLRRFLRHEPISARPVGRTERARRWCRRNPAIAASFAIVIATLTLATAVSATFAVAASRSAKASRASEADAKQQEARADERSLYALSQESAARANAAVAEKRLKDLSESTFNLRLSSLMGDLRLNDMRQAVVLRDAERFPKHLRNFAWEFAARTAGADLEAVLSIPEELRPFHHFGNNVYRSIALSPNGDCLAMAQKSTRMALYDWKSKRPLATLETHDQDVLFAAFSPDGRLLAAGDRGGFVSVWDIKSRRRVFDHEYPSEARSLAFSPDGRHLAVGLAYSQDITLLRLDDLSFAATSIRSAYPGPIQALRWSADGQALAVGTRNENNNVCVLHVDSGQAVAAFHGAESDNLDDIAFSPDGATLIVGTHNSTHVWDVVAKKRLKVLPTRGNRTEFTADGKHAAVVGLSDVFVYSTKTWELTQQFRFDASIYPFLWFSEDGISLACGVSTGEISRWRVCDTDFPAATRMDEKTNEYVLAVLDGDRVLTGSTTAPRAVRVRDYRTGRLLKELYAAKPSDHAWGLVKHFEVAVVREESLLFLVCAANTVRCINVDTGDVLWERQFDFSKGTERTSVYQLWQFTRQEQRIVAMAVPGMALPGSRRTSQTETLLLDGESGSEVGRLDLRDASMYALAHASRRGRIAGRARYGDILVWDDKSLNLLQVIRCPATDETLQQIIFSPDQCQLIAADKAGTLYRIEAKGWQVEERNAAVGVTVEQLAFSPDGSTLLVSGNGQVLMFDPMTLESRGRIGADADVGHIAFNDRGDLFLSRKNGAEWLEWPLSGKAVVAIDSMSGK